MLSVDKYTLVKQNDFNLIMELYIDQYAQTCKTFKFRFTLYYIY